MKGSQESLTTVVVKNAANWPSPRLNMHKEASMGCCGGRIASTGYHGNIGEAVYLSEYGPAAPVSSSSLGSRQGLWPTITAHTPDMESSGPNGHSGTYLAGAVKQWGTPAANDANKTPHCEVNSNQAGLAKSVGLELQKQWGTPTARDHKSVRGNEEREYKELTPMVERQQSGKLNPRWVETLMGLPVGWTMPSCASPVTIALTNCDSSATESSQQQQRELLEF
jgi:hypothetical protein